MYHIQANTHTTSLSHTSSTLCRSSTSDDSDAIHTPKYVSKQGTDLTNMASWLTQSSVVSVLFLIFFVATFLSMKWCLIACHTYRCRLRTYSFSFSDSDLAFVSNLRNIIFIWTQLYYRQYLNTHNRQVHHPYIRIRHAFSNIIRLVVFFFRFRTVRFQIYSDNHNSINIHMSFRNIFSQFIR